MAESQGFEPWEGVNPRRISSAVPSTTQPTFRIFIYQSNFPKF